MAPAATTARIALARSSCASFRSCVIVVIGAASGWTGLPGVLGSAILAGGAITGPEKRTCGAPQLLQKGALSSTVEPQRWHGCSTLQT
jgi:hypothetical protein